MSCDLNELTVEDSEYGGGKEVDGVET